MALKLVGNQRFSKTVLTLWLAIVVAGVTRSRADQSLDHFMIYGSSATRTCSGGGTPGAVCTSSTSCSGGTCVSAPPFIQFGPIQLTDQFGTADYKVKAAQRLALPANKNAEGVTDPNTHLRQYSVTLISHCVGGPHPGTACTTYADCGTHGSCRSTRPTFPRQTVRVVNQCNDLLLDVALPAAQLLLPANKSLTDPVPPPDNTQHVDHFLCYGALLKRKQGSPLPALPKGMQVVVADQFQTLRYDLKKVTRLCNPVAKQEDPLYPSIVLSGHSTGTPRPITPASVQNPSAHLVCYQATLATRTIAQSGCGATNPSDHGTAIVPRQIGAPLPRGVFVDDQFGPARINPTTAGRELCIPSLKSICGNNVAEFPEACDGTDNSACDGMSCRADCTCTPATCGNNIQEGSAEACDGTDNAACGGLPCRADCSCTPPSCGDNIKNLPSEDCDGPDAASCPGQCQPGCECPTPACVADATRTTYAGRSACGDLTDHAACLSAYEMGDGARALACTDDQGSCAGCDHVLQSNNDCTNTCLCGNNALDPGEECDGSADLACPGQCQGDCRCPPPACIEAPGRAFVGWVAGTTSKCAQFDSNPTACNNAYFVSDDHLATSCFYDGSDAKCYGCEGIHFDGGDCTNVCLCGDNVAEGFEDCDGTADSLCPGQCQSDCRCTF